MFYVYDMMLALEMDCVPNHRQSIQQKKLYLNSVAICLNKTNEQWEDKMYTQSAHATYMSIAVFQNVFMVSNMHSSIESRIK